MSKYEIKDAIMLKEIMKQVATIKAKYSILAPSLDFDEDLKYCIEFIQEMVNKEV